MSAGPAQRQAYFAQLYGASADPYGVRERWYEQRKRAALLASLPRARYRNAFEPACGIGELSFDLAPRCAALWAGDANLDAVATARQRTAVCANVRIESLVLPQEFPIDAAPFDLIVLSEIGYFLSAQELRETADLCARALAADGALVACHWLGDFAQRTLSTQQIHEVLGGALHTLVTHAEADFLLQVWSPDGQSVAAAEGLK